MDIVINIINNPIVIIILILGFIWFIIYANFFSDNDIINTIGLILGVVFIIALILNGCQKEETTVEDVQDYSTYDAYDYVSDTEYWNDDEDIQKALRDAYDKGFEDGVQNTLEYIDSNEDW